jgi:hypothetical protein
VHIGARFSEEEVKKYLKATYGIESKFISGVGNKKLTHHNFTIVDKMVIADLIESFKSYGLNIKLFNSEGISIPIHYCLVDARDFKNDRNKDYDFNQLISSLNSISSSSDYSDMEWIKRIFSRSIKKARNTDQISMIKNLLGIIYKTNDKFLESDHSEVLEKLKTKLSII